jgi:catechol 2,3-dioxygenase-like lactoylglutathione lyase family enzyme
MLKRTIPVFAVGDMAKTVAWYRDILGLKPISNGARSSENTVLMARDRVEILFRKQNDFSPEPKNLWNAYFRVTGLDGLHEQFKDKVQIIRGPEDTVHDDREIELRDPNGYVLTLGEWHKKQDDVISFYDLHPVLPVEDILETVKWYKDVLGFRGEPWQKTPPYHFAMLYRDQVEAFFTAARGFEMKDSAPAGWSVYYRMVGQEIDRLYNHLKDKATVLRAPDQTFSGYTEFEITDNNGHVLCFSEMNLPS